MLTPTYVFATPVLGGQAAIGMSALYGRNTTSVSATLTGPGGASLSGSSSDYVVGLGDLYPAASLKWTRDVHNFILILFAANPMVAAGFLVLAVCPGAPYGPPFVGIARANVPEAVGLMVILAGSSAVVSPLLLKVLLPLVASGEAARIDPLGMMSALVITQLLPLLLGLLVRHRRPQLAERLLGPFELASKLLNLSAAGLILATQFQLLARIRTRGFVGMLILLVGSLVIGWLAGGPGTANRRTMALTTSLRNVGVGLIIVTGNFAGTPAVSAALSYGIVEVLLSLLVAFWWRRSRHD